MLFISSTNQWLNILRPFGLMLSYIFYITLAVCHAQDKPPSNKTNKNDTYGEQSYKKRTTFNNHGKPWHIPGLIEAENHDEGTLSDPSYYDINKGSEAPPDQFYRKTDVDYGVDTIIPLVDVAWIEAGEWLEYTVEVMESGEYDLTVCIATIMNSQNLHIEFDGKKAGPLVNVPNTGCWGSDLLGGHCFQEPVYHGLQLIKGIHRMRAVMNTGLFTLNWFKFEKVNDPHDKIYSFKDLTGNNTRLDGTHSGINFGKGQWFSNSNAQGKTRYGYFSESGDLTRSIIIPPNKVLKSIIMSSSLSGKYQLSDGINPTREGTLTAQRRKIITGWTKEASKINIRFTISAGSRISAITYGKPKN